MKRFRRFLLLLLIALSLNVLVAWSCTLWSGYRTSTMPPLEPGKSFPSSIPEPFGRNGSWWTWSGLGVWKAAPIGLHRPAAPTFFREGWPMYSLESSDRFSFLEFTDESSKGKRPFGEIIHRGLKTDWLPEFFHALPDRRLPLVPLWPGFLVNTTFYLLLVWLHRVAWIKIMRPRQIAITVNAPPPHVLP